jgi:phosphohistidine swiveling domain-containing protein
LYSSFKNRFAGVGLGRDSVYKLVRRIQKNPDAQDKWNRVKVLIIDESECDKH